MRIFLLAALVLAGCTRAPETPDKPVYELADQSIKVRPDAPFMQHLVLEKFSDGKNLSTEFQSVGQMLALANTSESLTTSTLAWVELEEGKTVKALRIEGPVRAGTAFGQTWIPIDYLGTVKVGETVEISRYSLKKTGTKGTIYALQPNPRERTLKVTFRIEKGQDWYPGTNCEVRFPLLKVHPVEIPKTALLHEGLVDLILVETSPNAFQPRPVTILSETPQTAVVVGQIDERERLLTRGAILLKPLLPALMNPTEKGAPNVP